MKCGYIGIIGKPNVGKSSLLNALVGKKISITANKPQTTRNKILGIKTLLDNNTQLIYVDTPGLHDYEQKIINVEMNRIVHRALRDVDVVVFLIEQSSWDSLDELVLKAILKKHLPVILAINKVDLCNHEMELLPFVENIRHKFNFTEIIPVAALKNYNLALLEKAIIKLLPENPFYFLPEQTTDVGIKFRIAEIIREKLFRLLEQEVPYNLKVDIERIEKPFIFACIIVERQSQKGIVIGRGGQMLKKIGILARNDIERLLGHQIVLKLWVKVKEGWSNDSKLIERLHSTQA